MSVFIPLGIVLLSMLIQGFLQLSPGVFAIFYHHALGKTSPKKADDESLSFVLGVEIAIAIVFLITYFVIAFSFSENDFTDSIFFIVLAIIFVILAIFTSCWYFRIGKKYRKTTTLFLPRHLKSSLIHHAENAKNRTDTIILGFLTTIIELPFTLPLMIISSVAIFKISITSGFLFIIAYIVIATLPLFTIRTLFRTNHNLAEIERLRIKWKTPFRLILTFGYLSLTILSFILAGVLSW